jgi:hypothetical protein
MEAILRTNGPFQIVYYDDNAFDVALQISRNLYQYFFADSLVLIFKSLVTIGHIANDTTAKSSMDPNPYP